ncbi:hypothetical protein KUW17_20245 [Leisingera aquaemixtae]|uniref:hypothetical protein n=1 Tax=Leisingera aquaemixtae TaxID=1396826 RepID=UPI001C93BA20|nr:hypothetical protein [Leisingera aquaemixtae]MBY6069085.1 hypothetical protein [Leisingera aquaemixtae]
MNHFVFQSRARSCSSEAGVLYCGYGEKYVQEAAGSARSLRRLNDLPCALFTDKVSFAQELGCFDYVLPFQPLEEFNAVFVATKRLPSLKLFPLLASPFRRTLHLDSDTHIFGDLSEAFDLLLHFDVLLTNEAKTKIAPNEDKFRSGQHMSLEKLMMPRAFNAGVFGYSDTETATNFIRFWIDDFLKMSEESPDSGNWKGVNDQVSLNQLFSKGVMSKTGVNLGILPNYHYNATGRMLPELHRIGALERVRIAHTHLCAQVLDEQSSILELAYHPSLAKFKTDAPT